MDQHVELLKFAKQTIKAGRHTLICIAVSEAGRYTAEHRKASREICDEIQSRLHPCTTVTEKVQFLLETGKTVESFFGTGPISYQGRYVRNVRLAWIDVLIEFYEGKNIASETAHILQE